jgi:hypothetical protein
VRLQERNLPAKSSGEFKLRFTLCAWTKFTAPVAFGNLARRCQVVLICPHWLRVSAFRCANPVGQRSRPAKVAVLFAYQVSLRF